MATLSCTLPEQIKLPSQPQDTKPKIQQKEQKKEKLPFSQGKNLIKKKQYEEAQKFFEQTEQAKDDSTKMQSRFYLAFIFYKTAQYKKALKKLEEIPESNSDIYLNGLNLKWKIINTQNIRDNEEKLSLLSQIIQYSPSLEKKQRAKNIASSIVKELSNAKAEQLTRDDKMFYVQDLLLFKTAHNLVKEKKFKKALSQFKKLLNYTQHNTQLEETARQYIQALKARTDVDKNTIGVILPLTGVHKKIGSKCLKGFQLGFGIYDEEPSAFKLVIVDSKGQGNSVRESMKELILQKKAIGVVGGVTSQVASVLAKAAQEFMVPSILLSQKSNLTQERPFIFQNAVTNKNIIHSLVDELIEKQGHTRFAVLYPNDPFGVSHVNLFWDYVESKGGEITGVQTYKPGEVDFNDSIKRLTGTYYLEDRDEEFREKLKIWFSKKRSERNQKQLQSLLPPIVNFSVLFIPDSIKSLHHIAPYLVFQNIKDVTLAGTRLWNSDKLLKQKLENIVFADALITSHPEFKNSMFSKKFYNTFGYKPGLFEFLSYQSALALRQALSAKNPTREDLREELAQLKQLDSPIGQVKISKNREFIYPITNFSVKRPKNHSFKSLIYSI